MKSCGILLLIIAESLLAGNSATATLAVKIQPAATLAATSSDAVLARVRLAPGSEAQVWKGSCAERPSTFYRLATSGSHVLALDAIPGEGTQVCLESTDGLLKAALAR